MTPSPLAILFGGMSFPCTLLDGTPVTVFVRALPQRYLLSHLLGVVEQPHAVVQLCCYVAAGGGDVPVSDYPTVPAPAGYWPVPANWSDNLSDASLDELYEAAKHLNFTRLQAAAERAVQGKKFVAPLHKLGMDQVMPLVQSILEPLLTRLGKSSSSTPSAPSTSAVPASNS